MKKKKGYTVVFFVLLLSFTACESFLEPDGGIIIDESKLFKEWNDFRAASMGLYSLQQELVEQLVVLGELRGDLLEITENACNDLREVHEFNISRNNKYASPRNFYRLIINGNKLVQKIAQAKPSVLEKGGAIDNYDRLYGEVQCMLAWAYFNAVRIYGKVPYIYPHLNTIQEIEEYVNSGYTVLDSMEIFYDLRGYHNDTVYNVEKTFERKYLDLRAVVDTFSHILENNVKIVGLNHHLYNQDITWEITGWNLYSYHSLLGQMYLHYGNLPKAAEHFRPILYHYERYLLDNKFQNHNWKNIFLGLDTDEHIYTIWFDKAHRQQNNLQFLFSNQGANAYKLRPTSIAIGYWEHLFRGMKMNVNPIYPERTELEEPGIPGDFFRGHEASYLYYKDGIPMTNEEVSNVLLDRLNEQYLDADRTMEGTKPVVFKYCLGKSVFDRDANFSIFRAGGIHLYAAEVHALWMKEIAGVIRPEVFYSLEILNDGAYKNHPPQLGVRGRVGFGKGDDAVRVGNFIYRHDPYTNKITGWHNFTGNLLGMQVYLLRAIMDERARELAFEGERYYDLMRVADRTNNPAYLADKIAAKFEGPEAERIRNLLMDQNNWYVRFFDE